MSVCKTCGNKYSKWTTPVSARGVCRTCFEVELYGASEVKAQEHLSAPEAGDVVNTVAGMSMPPTELKLQESVSSPAIAAPQKRTVRVRWTSFLPRTRSKVVFALVMGAYCSTVGAFVSAWASVARVRPPPKTFYLRGDVPDVLGVLVFGPVIESLMLVGVFELLRRFRAPNWAQVVTSALFISEMHVWPWWPHAVIVLPSFLIQAASYQYWRRTSWKEAFWVLVAIHAINNVIPTLSAISRALRHA